MKDNLIVTKSYNFALSIIHLSKKLIAQNEYVLSRQILKSGTSIGANVEEAIGGISKKDFRAKNVHFIQRSKRNSLLVKTLKGR